MNTYDIKKHLIGVGIRPSCAGLNYLSEEIMEAMEASEKILFYNLHQEVAKKYNTTPGAVERGARHAMQRAMDENPNFFDDIGSSDFFWNKKFTLSDFVYSVAYQLQEKERLNGNDNRILKSAVSA